MCSLIPIHLSFLKYGFLVKSELSDLGRSNGQMPSQGSIETTSVLCFFFLMSELGN